MSEPDIQAQYIRFVPGIEAQGNRAGNGVAFHRNVCRAPWRAHQSRELHELPFAVIESGAATVSFGQGGDVLAILLPGELSKHAVSEGTKACSKYTSAMASSAFTA